mmetsp:Transcript_8173/g.11785  ORF Transcript_8173/g.11785 Transcript_8173/m.11785 type:complete len:439 (+) Transcript_8173:118-1434(+)
MKTSPLQGQQHNSFETICTKLIVFFLIIVTTMSASTTATKLSSAAATTLAFHIGTEGLPWGSSEKSAWFKQVSTPKRSYHDEVLSKLETIVSNLSKNDNNNATKQRASCFEIIQYGALPINPERYPLMAVKSNPWISNRPCVLVTGGVHGYETSGVQGALLFLKTQAQTYVTQHDMNVLIVPCVSPWAYETIQRWNAYTQDPNREFSTCEEKGEEKLPNNKAEEAAALMRLIQSLNKNNDGGDETTSSIVGTAGQEEEGRQSKWICHLDLHETTDTDVTEFRPARDARDGKVHIPGTIPDGFYLVADSANPQLKWHEAIINSVRKVTHIAPPDNIGSSDDNGKDGNGDQDSITATSKIPCLCGQPIVQEGVIAVPAKPLGLCSSLTGAKYVTTTEVYPDSPLVDDDQCNRCQVAAITGALDYIIAQEENLLSSSSSNN